MKKLLSIVMVALLVCALALPALADDWDDRVIKVSGNATVTLAADTATIQLGVNTKKPTVAQAQQENNQLMNAVLQALYGMGLTEKDVITSSFNVYSYTDYTADSQGMLYYEVDNMLSVTIRDLSQIGAVLDAAMSAGANTTYGISFSSTQENEAYQKALTRAVEDAAQKAQVLAAAAGKTLGELVTIDATNSGFAYGVSNVYSEKAMDAGSVIVSGDVSVTANVTLEYAFK